MGCTYLGLTLFFGALRDEAPACSIACAFAVLKRILFAFGSSACPSSGSFLSRFLSTATGSGVAALNCKTINDFDEPTAFKFVASFSPLVVLSRFSGPLVWGRSGAMEHFFLRSRQYWHALLAGPTHSVRVQVQVVQAGSFVRTGPRYTSR